MGRLDGESGETLLPRKNRKGIQLGLNRSSMQASAFQKPVPPSSPLHASFSEKYGVRERLKAEPYLVLKSSSGSPSMNTSNEEPSSFFSSDTHKPCLRRSSGLHKGGDHGHSQASQEKHQTKFKHLEEVVASNHSLNCVNPSFPTTVPFSRTTSLSSFLPQASRTGIKTTPRTAHSFPSRSTSPPGIAAISTYNNPRVFLLCS